MRRISALCASLWLLGGCAAIEPVDRSIWPDAGERIMHAGAFLQVTGVGKPDPKTGSKTQRRSTSRDAAILDARLRLREFVERVQVGGGSAGQRAAEDPAWSKRIDAATLGFEVAETRWDDSDVAAVVIWQEKAAIERALGIEPP